MNRKIILKLLGIIMCIEAVSMVPSLLVAVYCSGEDIFAFAVTIIVCAAAGIPLSRISTPPDNKLQLRDGYIAVALCWVFLSALGAMPFVISGVLPSIPDALFESASGFTTTGATTIVDVEACPRGILLWRSTTQWVGGMGILVMTLALLPKLGAGSVYLMRAESPGPIKTKLVPKIGQSAKILYIIYIVLTVAETICLKLAGMSFYDSVCHAMATTATGGFSTMNASIAAYNSNLISWIILIFMFLSGINFSLFFALIIRDFRTVRKSEELWSYIAIIILAVFGITASRVIESGADFLRSLNEAAFQVVSVMTTTGFSTADYSRWTTFSQAIILFVMFIGGCAGSTAGGMKVSRMVILFKVLRRDIKRILHPRVVETISMDGKYVEEPVLVSVSLYFFTYSIIIIFSTIVVALDDLGLAASLSAAMTCVGNVGPGIDILGPSGTFAPVGPFSKIVLCFGMLFGRLELMPMLVLFTYPFSRNSR
jgi:trk system potassium uptake protein TrkH